MPILFIWNTQSEEKERKLKLVYAMLSQCVSPFHVRAFSQTQMRLFVVGGRERRMIRRLLCAVWLWERAWMCLFSHVFGIFSTLQQSITFNHWKIYAVQFVSHLNISFPFFALKCCCEFELSWRCSFRFAAFFVCYILLCFFLCLCVWVLYAVDIYICYL